MVLILFFYWKISEGDNKMVMGNQIWRCFEITLEGGVRFEFCGEVLKVHEIWQVCKGGNHKTRPD